MLELEKSLCASVRRAFRSYEEMADWWLFHAPEHYLQNAILVHMGKEHELYPEATYKKIVEGEDRPRRGRPPKDQGKRYDLIVWHKSSRTIRAVIEIKRSWSMTEALRRDAARIKAEGKAKDGYLIVYSEVRAKRGKDALCQRFERWAEELDLKWLNPGRFVLGDDENWVAAFGLFKRYN